MNSTFKIEDASEGSPFGFDTTFLQDDPVEVKATERLKKSFKPKRVFESRLLVDPYLLSRQVENGKLSSVVKKLFIEPYTLAFTSVDYDSENENDLEKYLPVANATKFYDKLEPQRIKASPLVANHAEKTYEAPYKKKKVSSRESSTISETGDFSSPPKALIQPSQKPAIVRPENRKTYESPFAKNTENIVAKDISEKIGSNVPENSIAKPVATNLTNKQLSETNIFSSPGAQISQPELLVKPQIRTDLQKVQVRLSDGRILLMSRELFLKLQKSGPANNSTLTAVEKQSDTAQQQPKQVFPPSTTNVATSPVPQNSVLSLPNSQPGPRLIIQHRPVGDSVNQAASPVVFTSVKPQIRILSAQGSNNPRIVVNPGNSLYGQLSKIQQLKPKENNEVSPTTSTVEPLGVLTTNQVITHQANGVPSTVTAVQKGTTSCISANRIGSGQLRLPFGTQNQPVRVCFLPATRNPKGSLSVTSPKPNLVMVHSPGNIRQSLVKTNSGQGSPIATGLNLASAGNTFVIQQSNNVIVLNGQQQTAKSIPLQIIRKIA